jgi:four helix bundle protein
VFAFEDLQVYQKALSFSVSVIDCVDVMDLPRKHYRLIEQLEASCTSVALNIAEGKGRFSKKEFKHFLYIARGSLYETLTMLQIFLKKEWLDQERYEGLYSDAEEINRMLSGLINSLSKSL